MGGMQTCLQSRACRPIAVCRSEAKEPNTQCYQNLNLKTYFLFNIFIYFYFIICINHITLLFIINIISIIHFLQKVNTLFKKIYCGVGSPKTRWEGCKLVCNHELVVPSQFAEAKRRNPIPNAIKT